jgi:pantoate--beta-alanine ligase
MLLFKTSPALKKAISQYKSNKKKIGFVPTMGFLHEGHLSLIRAARKENDVVVSSLFVNPLQFGPKEDLKRYPRNFSRDKELLRLEGTDILYAPERADLYPEHFQTSVAVGPLSKVLCGLSRPTHFAGVATVVLKLLNLVQPNILYIGQKDFQQCRVLEQMITDLDLPVLVRRMPIIREKDGLAMSSRNSLLSPRERQEAVYLSRALAETEKAIQLGSRNGSQLKNSMKKALQKAVSGRLDYAEIVDSKTLLPVVTLKPGDRVLAAVAVYFSKTRLIDNVLVKVKS